MKIKYVAIFVLLGILLPVSAFSISVADIRRERATKLEIYLAQKDKLIISDVYPLGELKEPLMLFEAVIISEPGMSSKFGGIRVYTPTSQGLEYFFAYVDSDAIDNLSKAVISMIDLQKNQPVAPGQVERQLFYSCKGGFMVEFRESKSKQRILIGGRHTNIVLDPPDLTKLRPILEKAQEVLKKNNVINIPDDKFPEVESMATP